MKNIKAFKYIVKSILNNQNISPSDMMPTLQPRYFFSSRDISSSIKSERKKRNKMIKATNGNILNQIKILTWNKGNCDFKEAINEIKDMIIEKKPDICVINELNYNKVEDYGTFNIEGFNVEIDNLDNNFEKNRTAIIIKDHLTYQRIKKYEAENSSIVCIKVGFKGKKKFFVNGYYRQWHLLYKNKELMRMSGNPTQLAQQFEKQASLWEQQSIDYPSTEIIITGDFNFDSNDLFKEYHERTEYANSHNKIYKIVEEK